MLETSVPAETRKRGELEALRGIAAVAVLVGHCWGAGHGYDAWVFGTWQGRLGLAGGEGLALFFALSGYLLTRMLIRPSAPGLGTYLRHRVARIIPTWWFVLAVMLVIHDDGVPVQDWWRFPLLVQGFWADTVATVDAPAWTLAVEAQFYLLLPLLALVLRTRLAWPFLLGLAAVALALALRDDPTEVWRYSLPANFVYFVPGMALALLERHRGTMALLRRVPHARPMLLLLSLPFWLAFVVDITKGLWSAVGAGLTVAAVALDLGPGRTVSVLRTRGLVLLGTLSYGVYLWHEPLTEMLPEHGLDSWLPLLAVVLPLSLALSSLSYVLVERPFLRIRDGWKRAAPAP